MIVHPDIDPALITAALTIEPSQCRRKGESRQTPIGRPLPGSWPDTRWSLHFENVEHKEIGELVSSSIEGLPADSPFWKELAGVGGRATFILSVVGTKYQGSEIDAKTVAKLAAMGIALGLEVYAVPQNG